MQQLCVAHVEAVNEATVISPHLGGFVGNFLSCFTRADMKANNKSIHDAAAFDSCSLHGYEHARYVCGAVEVVNNACSNTSLIN